MASLDTLLPLMRGYVRNCDDDVLKEWLNVSVREFCRRTRYLRESIFVPTVTGMSSYALSPTDTDLEVSAINNAEYAGIPLAPSAPEEVPQISGQPRAFWFYPSQEIYISPTPIIDSDTALAVNMLLQPKLNVMTINDELMLRYDQAIAHGAIWRLHAMLGAGWANPDRIAFHQQQENQGIGRARFEADRQHRQFNYSSLPGF